MATTITVDRDTRNALHEELTCEIDRPDTPDGLWHLTRCDDPDRSLCGLRLEGRERVVWDGTADRCVVCDDLLGIGRDRGGDRDDASEKRKAEPEAEYRRLLGEGILPGPLYRAHRLTPAEIGAATT